MSAKTCGHCQSYLPHYMKVGKLYRQITCGHCLLAVNKNRKSAAIVCPSYVEATQKNRGTA